MTTDAETIADLRAALADRDAEIRRLKAELRRTDGLHREGAEASRRLNAAAAELNRAYDFYAAKADG